MILWNPKFSWQVCPSFNSKGNRTHLHDNQVAIPDAGCGTGLVGSLLSKNGCQNIDGLDYSPQMLKKQRKKVYRHLTQADLTSSQNIPDNQYDAVISVGTFTCAHVGPVAFNELLRVTKPGGHICFTVRDTAWEEDQYHLKMNVLEKEGRWNRIKAHTANYIEKEGSQCKIRVYLVT